MGYDIKEIKEVFKVSSEKQTLEQQNEIKNFISELENFKLTDDSVLKDGEKSTIYYIAGYIAKGLAKEKCTDCNELFTPGKVPISIDFDDYGTDDPSVTAKTEFINSVSRGGLQKPSDYVYITCIYASLLNRFILSNEELKNSLLVTKNPRDTFIKFHEHHQNKRTHI